MRDRDSQLIFESYYNSKNGLIFEEDGKKWEDDSSAWFWFKILDPTGISSYPDLLDAIVELRKRPEDVGPWAMLVLNIFLALPNFGLLALGVGGIGWAGLKGLAKTAVKAGDKEALKVAEKVLQMAKSDVRIERLMFKFGETLERKGLADKSTVDLYINIVKTGNFSKIGSNFTGGVKGEVVKDIGRGGRETYGAIDNALKGEGEAKPPQAASPMPTPSFSMKPPTRSESAPSRKPESSPNRKKTNPARQPSSGFEMLDL